MIPGMRDLYIYELLDPDVSVDSTYLEELSSQENIGLQWVGVCASGGII